MAFPRDSAPELTASEGAALSDCVDGGLLLVAGEGMLSTFPLVREETVIGRAPDCDVVIAHGALSRRHALLRLGSRLSVTDLGSRNGTRVAQRLLTGGEEAPLSVGESFHIGRFSLVVVRAPRSHTHSSRHSAAEALRVLDPTADHATPLVRDIAASGVNALILGETGVGKEVLAETLHRLSGRKGAFVRINCAALAPALFESELFGHEKGAFTGANQSRVGLLEAADRGTVFLDEVGELPAAAQAKLLRAIETKEIVRVGAVKPATLDLRFVAATNRDLTGEAARGQFRSDLYFRLDGVTLMIPPLRERREQIGPLSLRFLKETHERQKVRTPLRWSPDLVTRLEAHDWPGNVRELKAVLERAVLLARGGDVGPRHLSLAKMAPATPEPATGGDNADAERSAPPPTRDEAEERQRILDALEACAGNQTRAARKLGMARSTLVTKLALHRIPRPRK